MTIHVLQYMTRFQCLCGACPDLCCRGWTVHLSRTDYQHLLAAMTAKQVDQQTILRHIAMENQTHRNLFAGHILWNDRQECPFLTEMQNCSIHANLGEEALPGICAQFPRNYVRFGGRLELSGAFSCPEVVRLVMTLADPFAWLPLPAGSPRPRLPVQDPCADLDRTPYCRQALEVRARFCQLLGLTAYPLVSRLIFCAYLAQQTLPAFVQAGTAAESVQTLAKAMSRMGEASLLEMLHQQLGQSSPHPALAVQVIQAIVNHADAQVAEHNPHFMDLIRRTLAGYALSQPNPGPHQLWEICLARRQDLSPAVWTVLEEGLERFAHHFLLQEAYTHHANLPDYIRRLAVAIMVCKFLFFGLIGEEEALRREPAAARAALIRVFHDFAKSFSHFRLEFAELRSLPMLLMFLCLW